MQEQIGSTQHSSKRKNYMMDIFVEQITDKELD